MVLVPSIAALLTASRLGSTRLTSQGSRISATMVSIRTSAAMALA